MKPPHQTNTGDPLQSKTDEGPCTPRTTIFVAKMKSIRFLEDVNLIRWELDARTTMAFCINHSILKKIF